MRKRSEMKIDVDGRTSEKLKNVFSGGNRNANTVITFEIAHSSHSHSRVKSGTKRCRRIDTSHD